MSVSMKSQLAFVVALILAAEYSAVASEVPQTVDATWADFDPHAEPLEVEITAESIEDGIVLRHVRYVVGTFAGKKTRVAAFYAFPQNGKRLPGIIQIHGGGQRARSETATFWASHGYAAVAVNWGEHAIGKKHAPNTDWAGIPAGFLVPKHHNDVTPGEGTVHGVAHAWNSSWLLYSAAARRAITFLEQQPEADGASVGLTGHSMGGRLTVLTAIDPRVKAASPSVGGSGFLYSNITGVPNSSRRMRADLKLYNATIDCQNYWPLIQCPLLFLGATNDFNSPMEFVIRGFRSLPKKNGAMSFTPHMSHRFTTDNYAARVRWFETHLQGTFKFPKTATARLELKSDDGIPRFTVQPDLSGPHDLKSVTVFYGFDRDPRARFWRSADVVRDGDSFTAACHVMELGEPLFVFANVTYDTGAPLRMPRGRVDTSLLTITSQCRQASPHQLVEAGVKPSVDRQRLIEDFSYGWRDWSLVGVGHNTHWNYETHKVNDPGFLGPRGASLAFEIETTSTNNTLAVIMDVDRWRGYTGRKHQRFTALVELREAGLHSLKLPVDQFVTPAGQVLENYDFVTSLILTPGQKERPEKVAEVWQGKIPTFKNIRWEGGEFATRPKPYLKQGASEIDVDGAFRQQFRNAVDESIRREQQDDK
jgi:dienelactone hydrolase